MIAFLFADFWGISKFTVKIQMTTFLNTVFTSKRGSLMKRLFLSLQVEEDAGRDGEERQ
jgi:hypothetical protein